MYSPKKTATMRQILLTLLLVGLPLAALAQQECDFASQYMRLYNDEAGSLSCNTVSPLMMQRILQLDEIENNQEAQDIISQLKSIQILTTKDPTAYAQHFEQAKDLADRNSKRYRPYRSNNHSAIYFRQKKKVIVEIVYISQQRHSFSIISLTGNMTQDFIKKLAHI